MCSNWVSHVTGLGHTSQPQSTLTWPRRSCITSSLESGKLKKTWENLLVLLEKLYKSWMITSEGGQPSLYLGHADLTTREFSRILQTKLYISTQAFLDPSILGI